MDRHQKNKETFQQLWAHFWVVAGFFVFLVPVQVWCFLFFWCLPMFCEVKVTKPAKAPKNTKQTKWKWRTHRQAPKTKNKLSSNYGPTSGQVLGNLDLIFLCLCRFGVSSGLVFFCFFGACQCFVKSGSPNLHKHQKTKWKWSKHRQATKKTHTKKKKLSSNYGPTSGQLLDFLFFCACAGLVFLVVWCFLFFLVLANVL